MASPVGQSVLIQAAEPSDVTTPEMLQKAKDDLMAFFKSDAFEPNMGSRSTFKDALVRVQNDGLPALAAFLATLIDQAEEEGHVAESVANAYFDQDVDQLAFAEDVVPQMIAFVEGQEQIHGAPAAPTEYEVAEAKAALVQFIRSDKLEELAGSFAAIEARSDNEFDAFLVNRKDCPGYAKLFDTLIRDAVDQGRLDKAVGATYFNPKMDTLGFIQAVLSELG